MANILLCDSSIIVGSTTVFSRHPADSFTEGSSEYTTCSGLLTKSSSTWPESALFQIANSGGVPLSKLVIGKPGIASDADNGFMSTSTLASCVQQATEQGWSE